MPVVPTLEDTAEEAVAAPGSHAGIMHRGVSLLVEILRTNPWPAAGAIAGAVVFAAASVAGAVILGRSPTS